MLPFIGPESMPRMTMAEVMEVTERAWSFGEETQKKTAVALGQHMQLFSGFRRGQPANAYLGQMAILL